MNALTEMLDKAGLYPEVKTSSYHYRHPQYPSRCLVVEVTDTGFYIRFTRVTPEFSAKWGLDSNNVWTGDDYTELVRDFLKVDDVNPPDGAPPFEEVLAWCEPILHRLSYRFKRDRNYELNQDDLYQLGVLKVRECWLDCGNKPREEFEKIVSTSIWHRIESLMSKHFVTQSRAAEVISITEENVEMMPGVLDPEFVNQDEVDRLEERISGMTAVEKEIVRQIHSPHPLLRCALSIETARYNKLKRMGVKRLPAPRLDFSLIPCFTQHSYESVEAALNNLMGVYGLNS